MSRIRFALIQQRKSPDVQKNWQNIRNALVIAKKKGANAAVFSELFLTPYFCQTENPDYFRLALTLDSPEIRKIRSLAVEFGIILIVSVFEKRSGAVYHNTVLVIERDGSIAGIYRKMHIPDDPGYYEKFYFTPGDIGFRPIKTSIGNLGILICWDQWFPEAARLSALNGADFLIYPTAIGWDLSDTEEERNRQLEAWLTVQRGHAVANGLPVMSVNRTGFEPSPAGDGQGIFFWGNSFVCGPQGEYLNKAPADKEGVILAVLDSERSGKIRRIWPFFRDRRTAGYKDLVKTWVDSERRLNEIK